MKFYESNDLPEDAVPLRVHGLGFDPDLDYLLNYAAECAAQQWLDDGDGDCYKGWPRTFIILNDDGTELGRRKVDVDYDPTFYVV